MITRVEVIDETGRAYVRMGCNVSVALQDGEKTLKIFVSPLSPEAKEQFDAEYAAGWKEFLDGLPR